MSIEFLNGGTHGRYPLPAGMVINLAPVGQNSVSRATTSVSGLYAATATSPIQIGPFVVFTEIVIEVLSGAAGVEVDFPGGGAGSGSSTMVGDTDYTTANLPVDNIPTRNVITALTGSIASAATQAANASASATSALASASTALTAASAATTEADAATAAVASKISVPIPWDALNNIPHLASSTNPGPNNSFVVATPGTTNLDGNATWLLNDVAMFGPSTYTRVAYAALLAAAPDISSINLPALNGPLAAALAAIAPTAIPTTFATTWDMAGTKDMGEFTITAALALVSSATASMVGGYTEATLIADGSHVPTFDGSTLSNWTNTSGARNRIELKRVGNSKYWSCGAAAGASIASATAPVIGSAPVILVCNANSPLTWLPAGGVTGVPSPTVVYDIMNGVTVVVAGATSGAYTPSSLTGASLTIRATATNTGGTATAVSSAVTVLSFGPLRAATPTSSFQAGTPVTTSTTFLNVRYRMPIWIGSGDRSRLRLTFAGRYITTTSVAAYANDYTVVKCSLESTSGTVVAVPVTFSAGSSRSLTVTAGAMDQQSDDILPSAFGLSKFTRGEKYYIRLEYSVASAGMVLPKGNDLYTVAGGTVGLLIDPAVFVGADVDATGTMTFTSGWQNFQFPYVPIVLGSFVTGDPKTFTLTGDSLFQGLNDTYTSTLSAGGAQRALWDADNVSNPIAGIKMALGGSTAAWWNSAGGILLKQYLAYTKYLVEEFGCNEYLTSPGTSVATAMAKSAVIWGYWTGLGFPAASIIKPKFTPRCGTTDSFTTVANEVFLNAAWSSGGNARAFNAEIDNQYALGNIGAVMPLTSVRAGSTEGTDNFYKWAVTGVANAPTVDGTHPSTSYYQLEATEYRTQYAALV